MSLTSRFRIAVLLLACAAGAVAQSSQNAPVIPSWLAPYPGVETKDRQSRILAESEYTAGAQPRQVVDHYRKVFAAAGLPFQPSALGYGFMIRAEAEECDLTIQLRNLNDSTAVRVTCAVAMTPRGRAGSAAKAEESEQRAIQSMQKYDQPVYPKPQAAAPPLVWPAWLVNTEGGRVTFQKGPGYLKGSFPSSLTKSVIQQFYADLLKTNGYQITSQSPANFSRVWVEGSLPSGPSGGKTVVRAEIMPAGQAVSVELRVRNTP